MPVGIGVLGRSAPRRSWRREAVAGSGLVLFIPCLSGCHIHLLNMVWAGGMNRESWTFSTAPTGNSRSLFPGFACPRCGVAGEPFRIATRPGVLTCRVCRRQTGLTAGAVMARPDRARIGAGAGEYAEVDETCVGSRARGEGRGVHHKTLAAAAVEVRQRKPGSAQDKRRDGRYWRTWAWDRARELRPANERRRLRHGHSAV